MTKPNQERLTKVRDVIKRDLGKSVEGVVKVFDRSSLAAEIREYVVTDKIEDELRRIFDTFTTVSDTIRRGGTPPDVMGIWISGFFGSGKSHFAKVLGYLLQNDVIAPESDKRCIDTFVEHLTDTPRGRDVRERLGQVKLATSIRTIPFEIRSKKSLLNENSVGEIILSEFYRHLGYSENILLAKIEQRLEKRGLLSKLEALFQQKHGVAWRSVDGRDDLMTVRQRLARLLPELDPVSYPDAAAAKETVDDFFRHEKVTPETVANELVGWVDAQPRPGGKANHLVVVIDEMGAFIADSSDRIGELNALCEMIGNRGKGRVWLIVTSQMNLEHVVERTNFQPALVGRLNARFELRPHLVSDEINKVVAERILKKHPSEEETLAQFYRRHEGPLAALADIRVARHLADLTETTFIASYPFLPHTIRLAQDIFDALSGFRLSGGVRSMIAVVMDSLKLVADDEVGALVALDQVFDVVENDLLSQEYLGATGVRSIREASERVPGTPIAASRVLKVLWLIGKLTWVPRVPETIAKLLARRADADVPALRSDVEGTLAVLQQAGYVARDEATGEWKFLNEKERTIEQAIQEMVQRGTPKSISIAAVRRACQLVCREQVVTRKRLGNFTVPYGKTRVPFEFGVSLDGETLESSRELEVRFLSPLASGWKQEVDDFRRQNQAAGTRGKVVWWVARVVDNTLEQRFYRYEALEKVTSDKRFTEDADKDTQQALLERRKERDELRGALVKEVEKAFLAGTLFFGGQPTEVEGATDMNAPLANAFATVIPNVFSSFSQADRPFDFGKQLKALLNPATTDLGRVAPELELFDAQGSLQRESPLVGRLLEVLKDLQDEGQASSGDILIDAGDRRGFPGFARAPFGWPGDLVRLVLAACLRAGAVFLEPDGSGGEPVYDYRGSEDPRP